MTSINSIVSNSSSVSSIYGNRNVISGLASGMDTETMIENAVSGYKTKITNLQQQQEMVQWKQEAYRSIIDKMVNLTRKYTSYTSSTNLFSQTFFNKAVKTTTNGVNSSLVSAAGKTSSNIQLDAVKKLATAAQRSVGLGATALSKAAGVVSNGKLTVSASEDINLDAKAKVSNIQGSMTLTYGASNVYLNFGELEAYEDGKELAEAINKKLADTTVKTGSGDYVAASDRIKATYENGKITFEDKAGAGNSIYVKSATAGMQSTLGFTAGEKATELNVNYDTKLYTEKEASEYLNGKTVSFTLDGVSKTIELKNTDSAEKIVESLQSELNDKYGKGKITVGLDEKKQMSFTVAEGSTLSVTSDAGKVLGIGESGVTSYLNTGKTLKDLLGEDYYRNNSATTQETTVGMGDMIKLSGSTIKVGDKTVNLGTVTASTTADELAKTISGQLGENSGITVTADNGKLNFSAKGYDNKFTVSSGDTKKSDLYAQSKATLTLEVNNTKLGKFNEETTLSSLMNTINGSDAGVNISYSRLTNEFAITSKETGEVGNITMGGGLADIFGMSKDTDVVARFKDDPLSLVGISADDVQPGQSIQGGQGMLWKDAAGNEVARKMVANSDGNTYIQVKNADGKWVNAYRQVTGENGSYQIQKLNGDNWDNVASGVEGQDAVFTVTVNGKQMELTRASNTVDLDGMSVTLKGEFGYNEAGEIDKTAAVTFTTATDSDTIVDAIKAFVEDYNAMATEIHSAYSTLPNEKSSKDHSRYMPLTDEDKKDMSDTAIANYEAKAKQGLLFGDSSLSRLYSQLTSAIQATGADASALKAMGITTKYSNGVTTLELDETALRDALDSNADSVRDAFTKTISNGASSNGLMYNLKSVMDVYANTSSGSMGLLIQKAGSSYSPSSINSNLLQKEYDDYTNQIEKWQTKMSDRIDYYTRQFTALEQLVAQMNNQSSMLSGLMGGY